MATEPLALLTSTGDVWLASLNPVTLALTAAALLALFFLLLAALWYTAGHIRPLLVWLNRRWHPLRDQLLDRWPPGRARWLRQRVASIRPAEAALLMMAVLAIWLAISMVVEIAEAVLEPSGVVAVDLQLYEQLQQLREPALDRVLVVITELGGAWITAPVVVAVALWLAWHRLWPAFGYWVGAAVVARLSVVLLKAQLERTRPGNIYSGVESFSFPSGHATTAMVLYGFLAFLLAQRLPHLGRIALYAVAAVLIVMIGFSRLYLGVHWLTDVAAGFALGFAWVVVMALLFSRLHPSQSPRPLPLTIVFCTVLVAAAALRLGLQLDSVVEHYQNAEINAVAEKLTE